MTTRRNSLKSSLLATGSAMIPAGSLLAQYADGSLSTTKGVYAYWALLTDVLSKDRLDAFVGELDNKETFNRPHRIPSLAANNPKYKENGRY